MKVVPCRLCRKLIRTLPSCLCFPPCLEFQYPSRYNRLFSNWSVATLVPGFHLSTASKFWLFPSRVLLYLSGFCAEVFRIRVDSMRIRIQHFWFTVMIMHVHSKCKIKSLHFFFRIATIYKGTVPFGIQIPASVNLDIFMTTGVR